MSDQSNDKRLIQWLDNELSDSELEEERGKEEVLAFKQILDEIDQWTPDNESQVFDHRAITEGKDDAKVRKLGNWIPMSIAASLLLMGFVGWLLFSSNTTVHHALAGESKRILLPDGMSKIMLGPGSEVSWNEDDWLEGERTLVMEGTAYFEVAKGDPFIVKTTSGDVHVLGTRFNVDQFGPSLGVAVYEGKVRAVSIDNNSIILSVGEKSLFHQGVWEEKGTTTGSIPSWVAQDETTFNNAPLTQVFEALEKIFGIEIDTGNVGLVRRFTGTIPHDDLEVALEVIARPLGITYEIADKVVTLSE